LILDSDTFFVVVLFGQFIRDKGTVTFMLMAFHKQKSRHRGAQCKQIWRWCWGLGLICLSYRACVYRGVYRGYQNKI